MSDLPSITPSEPMGDYDRVDALAKTRLGADLSPTDVFYVTNYARRIADRYPLAQATDDFVLSVIEDFLAGDL